MYSKILELVNETLIIKDNTIKAQEKELQSLRRKIENIEKYIEYYSQPTDELNDGDYTSYIK